MSENLAENKLESNETDIHLVTVNQADTSEDSLTITQETVENLNAETPESPKVSSTAPDLTVSDEEIEKTSDSTPKQVKKSRELKSLLEAVKEANLDTNISHKRKSDQHLSSTFPKTPIKRRNSSTSTDSFQSSGKRSTRSQNPEFVQKHKKFLKLVTDTQEDEEELEFYFENTENDDEDWSESSSNYKFNNNTGKRPPSRRARSKTPNSGSAKLLAPGNAIKRKSENLEDNSDTASVEESKKSKKIVSPIMLKKDKDKFCWRCHREGVNIQCETCPRSYHIKCLKITITNSEHWPCPECVAIIKAESTKTRSLIFKNMTQDHLCNLLKFAVKRMISSQGSEPFLHPVDSKSFPDYRNYIIQPMDLTTLQRNIRDNIYGSTVAFLADAKWILHNSIIFNSHQSKLTTSAKAIIKICKQEMSEIETCAECYLNANTKKNTWFIEVCSKPHILLWAKLKGFPFWPAKAMKHDNNNVHVKFFGAHDRAWVPVKECFLYSKKDPNTTNKQKRSNIAECVKEADIHIKKLESRYGEFKHAPYRLLYNPLEEDRQLLMMLPNYDPKKAYLNLTIKTISKDTKSNENSPEIINRKDQSKRSQSVDSDQISLSSTSKSSINSDKTKNDINTVDFDKFVEGYGTEDEDEGDLNVELRSKIAGDYITDSESEETGSQNSIDKSFLENENLINNLSSPDLSVIIKGKTYTRSLTGTSELFKNKPPEEFTQQKNDKINKIELEDNVEFSIGTIVQNITNREVDSNPEKETPKISYIPPHLSMADKLIQKINKSMSDISKKGAQGEPKTTEEGSDQEDSSTPSKEQETVNKNSETVEKNIPIQDLNPEEDTLPSLVEKPSKSIEKSPEPKEKVDVPTIPNLIQKAQTSQKNQKSPNLDPEVEKPQELMENRKNSLNELGSSNENQSFDISVEMPLLEPLLSIRENRTTNESHSADTSWEQPSFEEEPVQNGPEVSSFIKVVNFNKMMEQKTLEPEKDKNHQSRSSEKDYHEVLHDQLEIKAEPVSDSEDNTENHSVMQYNGLSLDKNKKTTPNKATSTFKVVDNLTKVIDEVAKNAIPGGDVSVNLKQRARKTFPSINKPTQVYQVKKFNQERNVPKINTVPVKTSIASIMAKSSITTAKSTASATKSVTAPLRENLVYISQNQSSVILPPNQTISIGTNVANPILAMVQHSGTVIQNNVPLLTSNSNTETITPMVPIDILSEDVCKTVGDMVCKPPPKLKPKPPGPLSTMFDEGAPSSAGPVTQTVNSIAHRMSDYFCGLLNETLSDLVNIGNTEAKIKSMELEIENLKHKHTEEMLEFRKNLNTILKDVQKSIIEEKNKIIDETRSKCEEEKKKAVEEAKSKQWCAFCFKEAQFYCCWNTSYCDYPCQQKHWTTHMKTCSQSSVKNTTSNISANGNSSANKNQSTTIFKTIQKPFPPGTKIVKASRMIQVKPGQGMSTQKSPILFQRPVQLQASNIQGQSTLTLLESTPGNFEIVGSHEPISLNGKLIPTTVGKVKTTTTASSVSTPSQPRTYIIAQKPVTVAKPIEATNVTNTTSDKP